MQRLHRLDIVISQKTAELDDLRVKSQSTGSVDYSREHVQTSPTGDPPFERLIGRMIELEAEINAEIDAFVDEKHRIINQIQALQNPVYVQILHKRYVEFKSLEQICVEMNFSYDYIKHLHGYALQEFETKILNSTPNNT